MSLGSAFESVDSTSSPVYNAFLANRNTISQRLRDNKVASDPTYSGTFITAVDDSTGTREGYDGYSYNSAEVLIPAFLAAYGIKIQVKWSLMEGLYYPCQIGI